MTETIRIVGLDRVIGKLDKLGKLDTVRAAIKAAAYHVQGKMKIYPPQRRHKMRWKSEKQKRWFFAALREGRIQVPYRRTKNLSKRWSVQARDGGLSAVIGNNIEYGPLVQSESRQYWMHRATGWQTTRKVMQDETAYVNEQIAKAVRDALK